jgi:hypothetical protein
MQPHFIGGQLNTIGMPFHFIDGQLSTIDNQLHNIGKTNNFKATVGHFASLAGNLTPSVSNFTILVKQATLKQR